MESVLTKPAPAKTEKESEKKQEYKVTRTDWRSCSGLYSNGFWIAEDG
jgi:hypothetical protein